MDKRRIPPWTDTELDLLHTHYSLMDTDELLELFPGRTLAAINRKAMRSGIERVTLADIWRRPEKLALIEQAFASEGKTDKAAAALGINSRTLVMWIGRYRDVYLAVERGRARWREANPPKQSPRPPRIKATKTKRKEPPPCGTCYSWARRGANGVLLPCQFPCMLE